MERYSVYDIAKVCGISPATFYNWLKKYKALSTIANKEKEVNSEGKTTYSTETLNAFINEAKKRGKAISLPLDKDASNVRKDINTDIETHTEQLDNAFTALDNGASNDKTTPKEQQKDAKDELIAELRSHIDYLQKKLDEADNDKRELTRATVQLSANFTLLQTENKRLLAAIEEQPQETQQQKKEGLFKRLFHRRDKE